MSERLGRGGGRDGGGPGGTAEQRDTTAAPDRGDAPGVHAPPAAGQGPAPHGPPAPGAGPTAHDPIAPGAAPATRAPTVSSRGAAAASGPVSSDVASPSTPPSLSVFEATLPILTMLVLFVLGTVFLGGGQELLIGVLLCAAAVAGLVAVRHGHGWDDIQRVMGEKLAGALPALLILLAIGALIGTWVLSGTIPYLVYWGIRLVSPSMIVLTAFLVTAVMSTFTGTSWGSAGTVGVALMGTAAALDAPLTATAGAIVSGAYFGDKVSPLSDSTNIAAIGAGAPLYSHIRHLMHTAVPSFVVAFVVYAAATRLAPVQADGATESARALVADLEAVFRLHWVALLPPAVVVWCIVRRVPPALAIMLSSLVAAAVGILFQPFAPGDAIAAAIGGFRTDMATAASVDPAALGADFTRLVERGGLYSMANTFVVIFSAFLLAAAMEVSGAIGTLVGAMLRAVRSAFGLIASTMAAGATTIALTSHGGVTSLVIGDLFQRPYRERGLAAENLSRSIEDSVTITEPLMPWTVSAIFMAQTLGVPTIEYLPWAVFCYGGSFFSLLLAWLYTRTGYGLKELTGGTVGRGATREAAGGEGGAGVRGQGSGGRCRVPGIGTGC